MKITIYEPKEPEQKEKELCLRLRKHGRSVALDAVDEDGKRRALLLTVGQGGILRACCVSPNLGLPLDEEGRVKVINP